jgi:HAD superfamily hydrolase (TIGR01509 family)
LSLEAIIFDVDGTLAETEEVHRAAFNQAFRDAGLSWHWDPSLYARLLAVTGGKERIRHFIDSQGVDVEPLRTLAAEPGAAIAVLHLNKTRHYGRLMDQGALGLRRGFERLITQAHRAGIRLAIATTTSLPNVTALLRTALGSAGEDYFEVIAAGDSVARKKPAPDIYMSALSQLGLAAHDCLAVEDSQHGLRSALEAGIATLVVRSSYTRGQDFVGAALIVDALDEAPLRLGTASILEALQRLHSAR